MTSKEELVKLVKDWITINNEICQIQKTVKQLKIKKTEISNLLIAIMNKNEVECFDTQSGKLLCKKVKSKSAITTKHLTTVLDDYFKQDDIDVAELVAHINNTRTIKENNKLVIK